MNTENWIETKKEAEIDSDGKLVVNKITLEKQKKLEKREIVDYALKFLGLLSIGIPLVLFFLNQKSEKKKILRTTQLQIYSSTITDLHQFSYVNPFVPNYEDKASKILTETYPKVLLLDDKKVLQSFDDFNEYIEFCIQNNSFFLKCNNINSLILHYLPEKKYPNPNDDYYYLEYQRKNLSNYEKSNNIYIKNQLKRINTVIDNLQNRLNNIDKPKPVTSFSPDRGPNFYRFEFQKEYQKYTKEEIDKISEEIKNSLDFK